jgi:hypothetical protein
VFAGTHILYMELHLGRRPLTGDGDRTALGHGVQGVLHEIVPELLELESSVLVPRYPSPHVYWARIIQSPAPAG